MTQRLVACIVLASMSSLAAGETLRPETAAAFDHYIQFREQQIPEQLDAKHFLKVDGLAPQLREQALRRLKGGEILVERVQSTETNALQVPNGLVHHWRGTVFIPGVTLTQTLAFLRDYDNQYKFYSPEVQRSKLLQRSGNDFKIFLRLRKHKVTTVVLNAEYDVNYSLLGPDRAMSYSHSTRIAEIENADKPNETEKTPGNDSGFLWRLNSYWRFLQRDGGVYVELEAISLTRDIPMGLNWLIGPFVSSIPRESLQFTLTHTRDGLAK